MIDKGKLLVLLISRGTDEAKIPWMLGNPIQNFLLLAVLEAYREKKCWCS